MKGYFKYYLLIVLIVCTLAACNQDSDNVKLSDFLYDYAPVNTGHYVIYDVDSIAYNFVSPFQNVDTVHYQIKEVVQDTFYDNLGKMSYRLEEYKRSDSTTVFNAIDPNAWYSYLSKNTYEKVEFDFRFIKLVFPPIIGNTWKGNQYLPTSDTISDVYQIYAGWDYTYTAVNIPTTINGLHFDSTLVATGVNRENKVDKKLSRETYARHIGLIYKEWEILNKQDVNSSWDAPNQVNGFRIRMRVNSYHL